MFKQITYLLVKYCFTQCCVNNLFNLIKNVLASKYLKNNIFTSKNIVQGIYY